MRVFIALFVCGYHQFLVDSTKPPQATDGFSSVIVWLLTVTDMYAA